jgi:hypothetical protein
MKEWAARAHLGKVSAKASAAGSLNQNSFLLPAHYTQYFAIGSTTKDHAFPHSLLLPALTQPAENTVHVQLPVANVDSLKSKDPISINVRRLLSFLVNLNCLQ